MSAALWYVGRGTGVVTLVLFTLVLVLGITARSGRRPPGLPVFAVAGIHRNAGLLATSFLGLHVLTLLLDPYAQLRLLDVVLPFAGARRPLWLGLGTVALDLTVAVAATGLLRARLGRRAWRAVHLLSYAAWPVALLHALGTGTDSGSPWLRALALGCSLVVAAAVGWRLWPGYARPTGRLRPGTVSARPAPAAPPTGVEALR